MTSDMHDDPLELLRAELAAVAPSPEFATRVRERLDVDLSAIQDELAGVAPSPAFAARVRQQIDADASSDSFGWFRLNWRWLAPAVGMAAAAVLFFTMPRQAVQTRQPALVAKGPSQPSVPQPPVVREPARPVAASRITGSAPVKTTVQSSEPGLEVITNQPAILREWMVRASAAAVSTDDVTPEPYEPRDVAVSEVEVQPIVVKWLVEPPSEAPVLQLPIIRLASAQMAERSPR